MAKVVELRPPATPRPSTFLPRERPMFDDLIFFYLGEALEVGIMVSEGNDHDGNDVDVHIYMIMRAPKPPSKYGYQHGSTRSHTTSSGDKGSQQALTKKT